MNKLLGLALLTFFIVTVGYKVYEQDASFNIRFYMQSIVSGHGAAYLLTVEFLPTIKNLYTSIINLFTKKDKSGEKNMSVDIGKLLEYDHENLNDFIALSYIRDRCIEINSKEALDHISAINSILFNSQPKKDDTDER